MEGTLLIPLPVPSLPPPDDDDDDDDDDNELASVCVARLHLQCDAADLGHDARLISLHVKIEHKLRDVTSFDGQHQHAIRVIQRLDAAKQQLVYDVTAATNTSTSTRSVRRLAYQPDSEVIEGREADADTSDVGLRQKC